MTKQQRLEHLLRGCSKCVYEEEDGDLFRHCQACQFEIAKLTYEIVIEDHRMIPKEVEFSNGLTKAQEEMFQLLEEECAEVIKAVSKIRRHGLNSDFDGNPNANVSDLIEECGDVIACIAILSHNHLIDIQTVNGVARIKLDRLKAPGTRRVHFITPEMIP